MDAADVFLNQCVDEGRVSPTERDDVRIGRESSGCTPPAWRYWTVIPSKELLAAGLTVLDCEIYANYPGRPLHCIAERLGTTIGVVKAAMARARRILPSLQSDPDGRFGLPSLAHMISLDAPSVPEPDPERTIKF